MAHTLLPMLLLIASCSAQATTDLVSTLTTNTFVVATTFVSAGSAASTASGSDTLGDATTTELTATSMVGTPFETTSTALFVTATSTVGQGAIVFPSAPSFVDAASTVEDVSALVQLLQQDRFASLLSTLGSTGTVLAPNNQALMEFVDTDVGQRFQNDDQFAVALLEYHSLLGVFGSDAFPSGGLLTSRWFETSLYNESARPNVGGFANQNDVNLLSGRLEESMVVQADLQYDRGYIHVIDKVLTLPGSVADTLIAGNFQALLGALAASTLTADDLSVRGGFTLLAPTNEAFQNIGNLLGSLSAEDITSILQYHVIEFPAYASDLQDGMELQTLAGQNAVVTIRDGGNGTQVFINGAQVVMPNVPFINGVIHGIDQVLNPMDANSPPASDSSQPQLSGATSVSSIPLTSGQPTATDPIAMPTSPATQTGPAQFTGAATLLLTPGALWWGAAFGLAAAIPMV